MLILLIGLLIAGLFLVFIYKVFPLGVALTVTGGGLATLSRQKNDRLTYLIGLVGSWLYPIGIIYSFIKHGILWGFLSIIIGFIAYKYAK